MDLPALERRLHAASAGAIVLDGRLLRRLIKAHRDLAGIGLSVPHAGNYLIPKVALLELMPSSVLGHEAATLPDQVILVARPSAADLVGRTPDEVLARLWRSAFHAEVHRAIGEKVLDDATIRARIDAIGQIEFDEIRAALRDDDRLFVRADDREAYIEFAALFLELRHFAPRLLAVTFPGLLEDGRVDAILAKDAAAAQILDRSFPEGAERAATVARSPLRNGTSATTRAPTTRFGFLVGLAPARPSPARASRLEIEAEGERRRGNLAGAAILMSIVGSGGGPGSGKALAAARSDLEALGGRINAALAPPGTAAGPSGGASWTALLAMLAEQAAARRMLVFPVEARLLYDLQRAAVAHEQPERSVDLVAWALSFGRTPIVRPLPATRETRVARSIRKAEQRARRARVPGPDRKMLTKLLRWAAERADYNVRAALRPALRDALDGVGLLPANAPERTARAKLIEELLDQAVSRGFISIGHLRDALSRNQLKLQNLASVQELWAGDPLLRLDRRLAEVLDGVYRGGEIYLRGLQKVSSVAFGTDAGRLATLYLLLPAISAYVLVAGVGHIISAIAVGLGFHEVKLLNPVSFGITAVMMLGLLHHEGMRAVFLRMGRAIGAALALIFIRFPQWILMRPLMRRVLGGPFARAVFWKGMLPLGVTVAIAYLTPLADQATFVAALGSGLIFAGLMSVMLTWVGTMIEDAVLDRVGPALQAVSRRVIPGLFRLIVDSFRTMIDLVERVLYRVAEWLRFREGGRRWTLAPKAVFALAWFAVAYVVRLYIALLIEPELNPLKHFPVVTVAQKLMLTSGKELVRGTHDALNALLSPVLGTVIGEAISATTVFFLPSIAGFLVWELKENWKLYQGSRPKVLMPLAIGHHGETVSALLVAGFHAGTVPKLFVRWRRAAQRADDAQLAGATPGPLGGGKDARFREGVHEVEEAIDHFVDRELGSLLRRASRWTHGPVEVAEVELGTNRIRVRLKCASLDSAPCEIAFDEQSGLLVASVPVAGFLARLPRESDGYRLFENALGGLYQLAGVDLVREQLEAVLGASAHYDIADEGLVIWPGEGYRTEVVYLLGEPTAGRILTPKVRGDALAAPPATIDEEKIRYRLQPIPWTAWVRAWNAAAQEGVVIPRLVLGAPLLRPS
ncbi:MAG: hypothetical protein ABJE95_21230 [Byssovorax sp.]